ncbi:MAG: DNA primase [Proteobacteria bacterium]|nr:DNA primase [Pseudomonadota bacterium]
MLVPKSFIDDLRSRLRLSDIIAPRVKLTRAGREFKACCPFHNEKSASFYVNDEKGFFHCFGCGAHGDQIGFLMRHQNLGFMDAVEILAGQAGMPVPKPSVQDVERSRTRDRLITLMDTATKWYAQQLFLTANKEILSYLTGRGLTVETIEAFRLGYAPPDSAQLANAMKQAGYTVPELIEAGLFKQSTRDGGSPFAFFRDRVMFPVTDRRGQTIAFGARVLPEHIRPLKAGDQKPPKYINSGETPLFQKGQILYNESHARTAAAKGQPVIVCEGYADVIALWQAGFTGAVAPLGTALTEAQITSLWSMIPEADDTGVREPVLCFDGDAAGQRAATRAMDRILPQLQAGRSARVAFLPDGMDPDDLIRAKGREAFEAVIATAIPMVDMIWRTLTDGRNFDTPEGKAGLQKSIKDTCAKIADLAVQKAYMAALRDKVFKAQSSNFAGKQKARGAASVVRLPDPKSNGRNTRARVALAAILCFPEIFHEAEDILGRLTIDDPRLDTMRQTILAALSEEPETDHEALMNIMNQKGFSEDLQDIMAAARLHGTSEKSGGNAQNALAGLREAVGAA